MIQKAPNQSTLHWVLLAIMYLKNMFHPIFLSKYIISPSNDYPIKYYHLFMFMPPISFPILRTLEF